MHPERLLLKGNISAFTVSPPCLPYFPLLEERALLTCDKGNCFFCPSAYPCCVFLLALPSSRHQVEVACGICHTATRAQTWHYVCLQSLHPHVLLVWKDTIQKSKIYFLPTQLPSMLFSNPPFILRNRAEAQMRIFSITQICWREDSRW